ncbi:MAG: Co2+/Mg2+ efflux protein ApaG [Bacteroidia bacterium]|nr:Co2+/Mg2+ efflux protein ApaG [Bacteroidia bacterium]MCO5253155.1 Co2+/Mg2+ efflux protein ApaG [Bacteroidota bacterium]MCZ2128766.1 Co2+/Mg2+ efflux protein ApaG [Bacteroidia bacterium]
MTEKTTHDIRVKVIAQYEPHMSAPDQPEYIFSYLIKIENKSPYRVQLLRRKWFILDYTSVIPIERVVEGEGVVGELPVLEPDESYSYTSFCRLSSTNGEMSGFYTFFNFSEYEEFEVEIPSFALNTPWVLN